MRNYTIFALFVVLCMIAGCLGNDTKMEEKETDNKAMESKHIKMKMEQGQSGEKGKRAPVALTAVPTSLNSIPSHSKVMYMPPVSLMIAMPHPSGRFLMLFPATQLVPVLQMPYASPANNPHSAPAHTAPAHTAPGHGPADHPAIFAARQQMLFGSPSYQPPREQYYHPYPSQYSNIYAQKRMPMDV